MPAVERLRHVTVLSHFLTFKQIRELKAVRWAAQSFVLRIINTNKGDNWQKVVKWYIMHSSNSFKQISVCPSILTFCRLP